MKLQDHVLGLAGPWFPAKGGPCPRVIGNHSRGPCVAVRARDEVHQLQAGENIEAGLMRLSDTGALAGVADVYLLTAAELDS